MESELEMLNLGRLQYSSDLDRWQVYDIVNDPVSLHCGECFEIQLGALFLPCRIELDKDWSIYIDQTRFYLHKREVYNVIIV